MRVLVTGSRDWDDEYKVIAKLVDLNNINYPEKMILVSGNCPTGADYMAENFVKQYDWDLELYPADWKKHGKKAGFIRNKLMVDSKPDICLAFIKNNSKGATMCAQLAAASGILVLIFRENFEASH